MIRYLVPLARRLAQVVGLLLLILLPLTALYSHYGAAHALRDLEPIGWRNRLVLALHHTVGQREACRTALDRTQGTLWSARIAGISLTDPLAGAEGLLGARSLYAPLLWSLVLPLLLSLLLGRFYCGWLCPMNTLLEALDQLRSVLRWLEIPLRDVRFSLRNKYLLLAISLGLVAVTRAPFLALVYPPAVLSREAHSVVFSQAWSAGAYVILGICAVELFVSRRWWCRYMCPGGALYSLLGTYRLVRVARDDRRCVQCGECVRVCQFDLKPMLVQLTGNECTNCGTCIRACQDDALSYRLVLPGSSASGTGAASAKSHATAEPAAPSAGKTTRIIVLLAGAAGSLLATPAQAHHILGLPHYSYKENYPQAPTLEYPAQTGPFDVLMTSFPGHPVPGERTSIAFYIRNRHTQEPYPHPVSLRVLRTSTFGENTVVEPPTEHEPAGHQHKYFITFPADGEYIAELTLQVEGKTEVIPFLMVAGEPSSALSVLLAAGLGLTIFLVIIRALRIKRQRRTTASHSSIECSGAAT